MSNTSATGGALTPTSTQGFPGGLTLTQFIQAWLVALSGLTGPLVRPKWQVAPPKQPDLATDWLAFGVEVMKADTFAYLGMAEGVDPQSDFQRQEEVKVACRFYGPNAQSLAAQVRDGAQIPQNGEYLATGFMGFKETDDVRHVPDFVNERWIDSFEMALFLRREVKRVYPVLPLAGAEGTVHSQVDGGGQDYNQDWATSEPETP